MKNQINRVGFEFSIGRSRGLRKPGCAQRSRAFTVLELVGVLAIMAIVAVALVPNIIRRIDRATWERETSDLNVMANGLVQTIIKDKMITNQAAFANAIANYLDLSPNQVRTNSRRFSRVFMTHPNLNIGGNNLTTTPYVQSNDGSPTKPLNAKVMIISTIAKQLPAIAASSFDDIWDTADGIMPSSLASSWVGGKAEDLCIKRLDLGSLFHQISLFNNDTNWPSYYYLDANTETFLPQPPTAGNSTNTYVLDGTALSLESPGSTPVLQLRVIIHKDQSFVYQNDRWGESLSTGPLTESLGPFGLLVRDFLAAPAPPYPDNWSTPQAVIDQFYSYLFSYWVWSQAGFEGVGSSCTVCDPLYSAAYYAQKQFSGANGLTANLIH